MSDAPANPSGSSTPRVLVVDDGRMNRRMCERMLVHLGCTVITAEDVESAVEAVEGGPFDLILSDVEMPGTGGVAGVERLREAARAHGGGAPPIVAISGQALGSDAAAYRAAGFDDYLPKPVMVDALREGLARWLAGTETDG